MKNCPHCKINIGGDLKYCPLCQNALNGEGERNYWPTLKQNKKRILALKITAFAIIATCVISVAIDYLFLTFEHLGWSPIVVAWVLISAWLTDHVIRKHFNLLKTMFVGMITISLLCLATELYIHFFWDVPYLAITFGYIIPILCSVNMVASFVLSFIDKEFTDHSLIYMLFNILFGIAPWIGILFYKGLPPMAWSVCLVINILAFAGLFILKGKTVINEFKKRFHL